MAKQFLIIGAGRFGTSVAKTLYKLGHDVMVVDNDENLINNISSDVTNAVQADVVSEKVLRALGIKGFDAVILAISSDLHISVMTALLLVEMKAKHIVAKAQTELHGRLLDKIGVNRIIFPEQDMGKKLAHSILAPSIVDLFELSDEYSVVEAKAPKEMVGKTLSELDLRAKMGVNIIAIRSENDTYTNISPVAEDKVKEGDTIIAIGDNKAFKKMEWI